MMEEQNLIEDIKKLSEKIKKDDIEENPESAYEKFQCECCGQGKMLAGSLIYNNYRVCNECVFLAESGFAMNKFSEIQELIDEMEENRFETVYDNLFTLDENSMN